MKAAAPALFAASASAGLITTMRGVFNASPFDTSSDLQAFLSAHPEHSPSPTCIASPTQAVYNPSFEDGADGDHEVNWSFGGTAHVSKVDQWSWPWDGDHYAVLDAVPADRERKPSSSHITQHLARLVPDRSYTLRYHYQFHGAFVSHKPTCTLTASVDGHVLDASAVNSWEKHAHQDSTWFTHSVSFVPEARDLELMFEYSCTNMEDLVHANVAIDAVTVTLEGEEEVC